MKSGNTENLHVAEEDHNFLLLLCYDVQLLIEVNQGDTGTAAVLIVLLQYSTTYSQGKGRGERITSRNASGQEGIPLTVFMLGAPLEKLGTNLGDTEL